ncbi:DNA polymerase epsilon subunit 4 [Macrosteles quadrilineatus]|uniref:DNA polymerase epsilon subunit 4 n=1 Tax=Macrosteles quadrilineatus TaxID=74068 RepID=UPI0023E34241|nr:DNA polymerase epsilon subunit 4 [Macrosteles quadrilineatus]
MEELANESGDNLNTDDVNTDDVELTEANTENQDESHGDTNTEEKAERLTKLPMSRIKHIMKMDPEVSLASQDAVFLISKATELFIQTLAKEAQSFTAQSKKKTIQKKDVESAVASVESLVFLEGALDI